jgi:thiol-disulfide isomerase/thioredoxin
MLDLAPAQYADDEVAEKTAAELEEQYPAQDRPEAVKMLIAILRGSEMGPREGWFGPAQSRFNWKWLAFQQGWDPAAIKSLTREQFTGSDDAFKRLDRDGDGSIAPNDFDWSDNNHWVQYAQMATRLFRRMNTDGDGRLTREDLTAFFERASKGKDHLTASDFRDALLAGLLGGFTPGDKPSRAVLVRGLLAGEVGSRHEGPRVDEPAPDFTLNTADGQSTYQLSQLVGKKPVVLVFGNFTCGPFRASYPEVDEVFERHRDTATFLMVYVREAHPLDGWKMDSNTKAEVAVNQPKTLGERAAVCDQFCQRLKPTLPVVVDTLDDAAGNAYSGMPARLYVIDQKGLVAYKSGRGPFGFKVGEMEQALVMAQLEASAAEPAK